MYSTRDAGDKGGRAPARSEPSAETRQRMAAALGENAKSLCDDWAEALMEMPGGIYAGMSRKDVLGVAVRLFKAYVEYLRTGDHSLLRETVIISSRRRFELGSPLVALLQTVGAARVTILPVLTMTFAAEPTLMAETITALMAAEELVAVWIAEAYEAVSGGLLQTAQQETLRAEQEKVTFGRDMARLATNERLILCDSADLAPRADAPALPIVSPRDVRHARDRVRSLAEELNWSAARAYELQLCVGEAGTNALRHAGTATFQAWTDGDAVTFRFADSGPGIDFSHIPSAFTAGHSTAASLGMGFTLMLELADTICLATDKRGTVLQLTLGRRGTAS